MRNRLSPTTENLFCSAGSTNIVNKTPAIPPNANVFPISAGCKDVIEIYMSRTQSLGLTLRERPPELIGELAYKVKTTKKAMSMNDSTK